MQPVGIEGAEKLRELAKKCSGTEHDLQYNAGRGGGDVVVRVLEVL